MCFATNTLKTGYYYFGDDQLCDYSGPDTSNLIGNYVYANGERVARFKGAAADVRYYLTDHLGSVVATVQRGGYLCNSNAYMPWGRVHASRVLDEEKFNYTGKERDGELGMGFLYYGARYYDPKLRVFLAVDPLTSKYPSWSPYAYCLHNPVANVDRDGKFVETAIDVVSVGLSAKDMWDDPSWANLGWLSLDIGAALLPIVPAVGAIRHGAKIPRLIKGADKAAEAAKVADKAIDAAKVADEAVDAAKLAEKAGEAIHTHHRLPVQFKDFFERAGLDIEKYTERIRASEHNLRPDGIHTISGGAYNKRWDEFIKQYPNAKKEEILDHLDELERELGLEMSD